MLHSFNNEKLITIAHANKMVKPRTKLTLAHECDKTSLWGHIIVLQSQELQKPGNKVNECHFEEKSIFFSLIAPGWKQKEERRKGKKQNFYKITETRSI